LFEVRGSQEKVDVVESLVRQKCQSLGVHAKHFAPGETIDLHVFAREQAVFSFVWAGFKKILKLEGRRGHDYL
jgi:hypothetical protein